MKERYFLSGGSGFIGSHFKERLGGNWISYDLLNGLDIHDLDALCDAMEGCDIVVHLASNPDIAKAVTDPTIDFRQGTELTQNILEAMRLTGVKTILYASGSGVYGNPERDPFIAIREVSRLQPISPYGASKLAGEALICAYCHMFGFKGRCFRFANIVGPRQTHGICLDFVRKLRQDPKKLEILGDGKQSKSYLHVDDAVDAMLAALADPILFRTYNVSTYKYDEHDLLSVNRIADMACEVLDLKGVEYHYSGGSGGWKGDVPVVRLNTARIRTLGWRNRYSSAEAVRMALTALAEEIR